MCLVSFAVGVLPQLPLVVAANRDELHERPARPAHVWSDALEVFAGRDLSQGGTWLGVAPGPRLAFVTNLRSPKARREGLSRGHIVRDYLLTLTWDRTPPAPALPPDIIARTQAKYLEAYELLTGRPL